jgi:hypothetical protein
LLYQGQFVLINGEKFTVYLRQSQVRPIKRRRSSAMKHIEQVSPSLASPRPQRLRRWAAIIAGKEIPFGLKGRDWLAFNTLFYLGILLIQFGLGMWINLFITIPQNHPGADATNFVVGFFQSVVWEIANGGLLFAIHIVLGLTVVTFHPVLGLLPLSVQYGPRGSVLAGAAAAVLAPAAAVSGAAYLTYQQDIYSLLMALGFGGVVLCYAISLYLLSRPIGATAVPPLSPPVP